MRRLTMGAGDDGLTTTVVESEDGLLFQQPFECYVFLTWHQLRFLRRMKLPEEQGDLK